ncbi:MAG TPA: HAD-IA family hydrolase [Fibrobacteria bacterium]|nr:HAD-IA family hydrolase [Fibrobacteria bacterium]
MLKLLVFDLDGTLADTSHDLAVSVNHALTLAGHSPLPLGTVVGFLGDGARTLITRSLMASGNGETSAGEIDGALEAFLEHYRDHCLEATQAYPGVPASLEKLSAYRKALLTNKPDAPAGKILAGLGLAGRFVRVVGGDNPFGKKPDPGALRQIMEQEGVGPEETLVIGDGLQDLQVAKRAGTRFLGFIGGLAPREALLKENPEAVFEAMADLPRAIAALAARPGERGGRP